MFDFNRMEPTPPFVSSAVEKRGRGASGVFFTARETNGWWSQYSERERPEAEGKSTPGRYYP